MSLFNILDQRRANDRNPNCDVVFEIWSDDWSECGMPRDTQDFTEWMHRTTVYSASMMAMRFPPHVTMYLYDPNWVPENFGLIVTWHPKLKRDQLDPLEYKDVLRAV